MQVLHPGPLSLRENRGTLTGVIEPQPVMREIFVLSVSGCASSCVSKGVSDRGCKRDSDRVSQCVCGHEVANCRLNHTRGTEARTYRPKAPGGPFTGQRNRR
jgi:hypothetical protein